MLSSNPRPLFGFFLALGILLVLSNCSQKPNRKELNRLEDARHAAEAAEIQLEKLRTERQSLEKKLSDQKQTLEEKKSSVNKAKNKIPDN